MHFKFRLFLLILLATLMASCASPEQRAAAARQQQYQAEQAKKQAQENRRIYMTRLGARCEQYGFKVGTTAYSQCIQNAEQQDNAYDQNQMAIQLQQDQQNRQFQQQQFQKAGCYFSGRLDC